MIDGTSSGVPVVPEQHNEQQFRIEPTYGMRDRAAGLLEAMQPSKEEQLEHLRENLAIDVHSCFLPKIRVPNTELGRFKDPSAEEVKEYATKGINIGDEVVKGVFYMNPCFCLTLYLISKLKEKYPALAKNIKLNIEILIYKGNPTAHAFIEIDDEMEKPLVVDLARNSDAYIYRGEYENFSEGAMHKFTISIPADKFGDGDNIYRIAENNKGILEKYRLTPVIIGSMLNARYQRWEADNTTKNYEAWNEYGNTPIYYFYDDIGNGKEQKIQLKLENDKIFFNSSRDNNKETIWTELQINKDKKPLEIYARYSNGDKLISFKNDMVNKFLNSIAA